MDLTPYQTIMIGVMLVLQTGAFTTYIAKLNTRVAVLEASHNNMTEDLKEIKADVKELLRSITS